MSTLDVKPATSRHHGPDAVVLRPPRLADAAGVHALVSACPPLDVNSPYAYMLVCTHFAATSIVAERDDAIVGFVSGYLEPECQTTLFIWQVGVAASARAVGLGRRLLDAVLARPACRDVRHLETTITPSNERSWKLFGSLARERGAAMERFMLFDANAFGDPRHEAELLARIGPFAGPHGGS
jgi:L-2,4-diaminobutyric acid acetyltransferase